MKEYIDSYLNTIQPKQKKSIKAKNIINEDFEKAKNNFWRTSKGKTEQIEDTINNVCAKYNLRPIKKNGKLQANVRGKQEGDYNIRVIFGDVTKTAQFFWIKGVTRKIKVLITDAENDEPVLDVKYATVFEMKSSWTEEELTKAINRALAPARS